MALKVNIGCGADRYEGWVNLDHAPVPGVVQADATALPIGSDSAECVVMLDVIEHLHPTREAPTAIREVHRILAPGGVFRVATLDLARLCKAYLDGGMAGHGVASQPTWYAHAPAAIQFSAHIFANNADTTPFGVYDGHQAAYDGESLRKLLVECGFREVVDQRVHESLSEAIRLTVVDRWPEVKIILEAVKW